MNKKISALCAVILALSVMFVNCAVLAFAAPSPEATVYPATSGNGHGGIAGDVTDRTNNGGATTPGNSGNVVPGNNGGYTGYNGYTGYTGRGRTTRGDINGDNNYNTNNGKDDPNSPNYTGSRAVSSDKSETSPKTSAGGVDIFAVTVTLLVLLMAAAAVTVSKKNTQKN